MEDYKLPTVFTLIFFYIIYSGFVYTAGTAEKSSVPVTENVRKGKLIWQEKNCTSCHQIYGLGGYMGPDLTNVFSAKGKGAPYIKVVLKYGMGAMPNYNLAEEEINSLAEFLKYVDASGNSPVKNYDLTYYGTIEHN